VLNFEGDEMRTAMSLTGEDALSELVEEGWFTKREDGWCRMTKLPSKKEMHRFIYLIKTLGAYSVGLNGEFPPIQVTRGGGPDELLWKVS
jgi:hypothetical protein